MNLSWPHDGTAPVFVFGCGFRRFFWATEDCGRSGNCALWWESVCDGHDQRWIIIMCGEMKLQQTWKLRNCTELMACLKSPLADSTAVSTRSLRLTAPSFCKILRNIFFIIPAIIWISAHPKLEETCRVRNKPNLLEQRCNRELAGKGPQ